MDKEKQNIEDVLNAAHLVIGAMFALKNEAEKLKKEPKPKFEKGCAPGKDCKDDALRYKTGGVVEPDPHDFCANAATAKTCKGTAKQLAQRAKQEVHALKNLAVLEGDETADKKAGRIYDLIDQIVACGVSEKRYGNSCILDHNAQHIDLAELTEIAQLRKENAELKEWCDKLNKCCNSLESEVQMLKAKIYDIQNKEK